MTKVVRAERPRKILPQPLAYRAQYRADFATFPAQGG
jgi:hypothetical protein